MIAMAALSLVFSMFALRAAVTDSPTIGASLIMISVALINSRRQAVSPEQHRKIMRRSLIAVAIALVIFAIGLGAVIYSKGA